MLDVDAENAVLMAWRQTLKRRGDAEAVLAESGEKLRTFREIEAESRDMVGCFDGLAAHSVVAVQLGNSARWPALLLALFRRSLIPLPLGGHMRSAELAAALATCRAKARVSEQGGGLDVARIAGVNAPDWPRPVPDFLKLTSGTTSAPRAIRFRAHQLLADCNNVCDAMGIAGDDVNYGAIPISHSYGFSNLLTPLLCRGVALAVTDDRLPRAILAGLMHTRATVFPGMPVLFQKLAETADPPLLPHLRLCISAGAMLPRAVAENFTRTFRLKIHTFYGSSECGGIGYDASEAEDCAEGFVGTPMPGVEIMRDAADTGPIAVRGMAVADDYFPEPERAQLGGGRFIPPDLVRWESRGMFLAGRVSDVINIAGRKLNPIEVEARLAECPGVRQAVVFGVRCEARGEEAVACVAGENLSTAALLRFCHEWLSPWQVPRDVWIVDEIPANERGKISRRELAERYRAR